MEDSGEEIKITHISLDGRFIHCTDGRFIHCTDLNLPVAQFQYFQKWKPVLSAHTQTTGPLPLLLCLTTCPTEDPIRGCSGHLGRIKGLGFKSISACCPSPTPRKKSPLKKGAWVFFPLFNCMPYPSLGTGRPSPI